MKKNFEQSPIFIKAIIVFLGCIAGIYIYQVFLLLNVFFGWI